MMAIAIAMETFFSTWGAWAKAGAAASIDTEARTASLTKRILGLPLLLGALLNPRQRGLMRPVAEFRRSGCCGGTVAAASCGRTTFAEARQPGRRDRSPRPPSSY